MTATRLPALPKDLRPSGAAIGKLATGPGPLNSGERHMLLVLRECMDWQRRLIPPERWEPGHPGTPSLTQLQAATGHCRTYVRELLFRLEDKGYLTRFVPSADEARRAHALTGYILHVPGSPAHLAARALVTGPDHAQRRQAAAELLATRRRENQDSAPDLADWTAANDLIDLAARVLADIGGRPVPTAVARDAVRRVLAGHPREHFRAPGRYLARALAAEPGRFLPAHQPPPASTVLGTSPAPGADMPPAARELVAAIRKTRR